MSDDISRKLSTESVISLHDLIAAILEHIWIVVAAGLLGVFGGFYVISKTPQLFETSSQIEVTPPKRINTGESTNPIDPTSEVAITTMMTSLNNKSFTIRLVNKMNLSRDPVFWGTKPGIPLNFTPDQAAAALAGMIAPSLIQDTHLMRISITHSSPELCMRLANGVALEFVEYEKDQSMGGTTVAESMILEDEKRMKEHVLECQKNLQHFRESFNSVMLDKTEIDALNSRVAAANNARVALESDLKQIEAHPNEPDILLGLNSINSNPSIAAIRTSITQWQAQVDKMQRRYTELHPRLIRGRAELKALQDSLNRATLEAKNSVGPKYEAALAQEKNLQEQALKMNRMATDYQNLQGELETADLQYKQVQKKKMEIQLEKANTAPQIAVRRMADMPGPPISPNKKKIWTMAIGCGISAGLLLAFVFYFLDSSIKRVEKAESLFKLPVLTVVPESQKKSQVKKGIVHPDDTEATVKESFRSLIVALNLLGGPPGCKVCLFTSSVPDEGKSFCSYHCATHLAGQGKKTLLMDMDLRRPSLHRMLQVPEDQIGTSDFLAGQADFFNIVHPTPIPNLTYLPSGSRSSNPIKLLSDGSFRKVLDIAMPNYDYIVLDTAPINAVADTLLLAEFTHHICLIIRTGKTSVHAIRRSLQSLSNARKEPAGIIMNRFVARRGAYYYYNYSYDRSYGPEEVYGSDRSSKGKS